MLRTRKRTTWDRTGGVTGGIDLSVSRAGTGSASSRASEISSGLEIGPQSEAWGRGIPPEHPGAFPATLLAQGTDELALRAVLEAPAKEGFVAKRSKQRLDSTHILGAVARLSALECVRETLALALEGLEKNLPEDRRTPPWWEQLWERYVESKLDYKIAQESLQTKVRQAGTDCLRLLDWLEPLGSKLRDAKAVAFLREVFSQQYELDQGGKTSTSSVESLEPVKLQLEAAECKIPMIPRRSGVPKAKANREKTGWVTKCKWPRR